MTVSILGKEEKTTVQCGFMSEAAAPASNLRRNQKSCTDNFGLNISSRTISAALLGEHPPTEIPMSKISLDHFLFLHPALTPDLGGYPHPSTEGRSSEEISIDKPTVCYPYVASLSCTDGCLTVCLQGSSYQPGNMSQPQIITSKENLTVRSRTSTAGTYSYVTPIPLSLTLMRLFLCL